MIEPINEYEQERRQKRDKLRELGIDPYGQREAGVSALAKIKSTYLPEMGHDSGPVVKGAGRIVLKRDMGKLSFLSLRDESGDLQIALDKKRLDETAWKINDLLDLGDQIIVEGPLGVTKKGEITIWATVLKVAAKSVLPPPGKWDGLSDIETRYRQRYVDLWANPDVMKVLKLRMAIVQEVRSYLSERGFVEVETPMMQPMAGGAAARPFVTHHNALDIPLYMRIAPELYLKRLLVGGFSKVFELNRNFRNEGISPRHNPEFTMLELYEAYGSWETMADLVEGMVCHIAVKLFGGLRIEHIGARGKIAIEKYLRARDAASMDELCRARLEVLFHEEPKRSVTPSTPVEDSARETGSEGYERDQDGFDNLIASYEEELKGKTEGEQRAILTSKFVFRTINLARPWRRATMAQLVEEKSGWRFDQHPLEFREPALVNRLIAHRLRIEVSLLGSLVRNKGGFVTWSEISAELGEREADRHKLSFKKLFDGGFEEFQKDFRKNFEFHRAEIVALTPAQQLVEVYEKFVEPTLIDPCFVTQVPSVIIPLAKKNAADPFFADVYELAINGQEISPGYTELNDPDVQAANFAQQVGDEAEKQKTDDDFLTALKFGMPPAGGLGLGIDRLVMMLTGAESIRDVILFPLMRPQQ